MRAIWMGARGSTRGSDTRSSQLSPTPDLRCSRSMRGNRRTRSTDYDGPLFGVPLRPEPTFRLATGYKQMHSTAPRALAIEPAEPPGFAAGPIWPWLPIAWRPAGRYGGTVPWHSSCTRTHGTLV